MTTNIETPSPDAGELTPQEVPVTGAGEGADETGVESTAPEAAPEGSELEAPAAPDGGEPQPDEASRQAKSGLQRRIDELVRQRHEAERQLEAERLERLREKAQTEGIQKVQAIDAQEPSPDGYETTQAFIAAHSRWAAERALAIFEARKAIQETDQLVKEAEEAQKHAQAQAARAQQAVLVEEKFAQGPAKYPDFVKVLTNPALPSSIGSPLFDAVMASDNAVDIAYSLGKNPAEYERLLRLSYQNPALAFKEVLTLDARFSGASKATQAPPPPPKLKGTPPTAKRLEEADYDEFVRIRRKQVAARNGRL